MVVYVAFLRDVACQKILNSANVSRSYSQNNTGTVFFETRCILQLWHIYTLIYFSHLLSFSPIHGRFGIIRCA